MTDVIRWEHVKSPTHFINTDSELVIDITRVFGKPPWIFGSKESILKLETLKDVSDILDHEVNYGKIIELIIKYDIIKLWPDSFEWILEKEWKTGEERDMSGNQISVSTREIWSRKYKSEDKL